MQAWQKLNMISQTVIIHENVQLGRDVIIEDYCIIGCPPRGTLNDEIITVIGDNAHIRSHTVIYAGNTIGNGFQTGNKVNIREHNKIGDNVSIGTLSVIEHHIDIGNDTRIHSQAFVPEWCQIGSNVWIGPNVVFTNARYPGSSDAKNNLKGVIVSDGAKIGANTTILPGVNVGEDALIGAGSLVTRDIPAGEIHFGTPAEFRGFVKDISAYD
jgi:acetyltransferase-like isoleucine patch superfamily enzyme